MIFFRYLRVEIYKNQNSETKTVQIPDFRTTRKVAAFGGLSSIRTKGHSSYKNEVINKTFLFMGNISPYYFKTIFRLCVECIPSFIKIGSAVSEKNGRTRQTFVVLYIVEWAKSRIGSSRFEST